MNYYIYLIVTVRLTVAQDRPVPAVAVVLALVRPQALLLAVLEVRQEVPETELENAVAAKVRTLRGDTITRKKNARRKERGSVTETENGIGIGIGNVNETETAKGIRIKRKIAIRCRINPGPNLGQGKISKLMLFHFSCNYSFRV